MIIPMYEYILSVFWQWLMFVEWEAVIGESLTEVLTQFWNLIFNIFARDYAETYNYVLLWIYPIFTLSHIKV